MPIEVLIASAEDAAAGIAELWLDDRLLGSTHMDADRGVVVEIHEGPWRLELSELHRGLHALEEMIASHKPGAWRAG